MKHLKPAWPILALLILVLLISSPLSAQTLTTWVEIKPPNDPQSIALGYPVPIPVDTPLPFDGFRTYAGLHMRHQDLAISTGYVHPEQIGTTTSGGRTIWAYRLGDEDTLTIDGLPEPAMLTNGGIHAREWQTPEVVTGILELMALHENDHHLYDYLRDNVNMIVIPSLNIDGFLQTQRTPTLNWLGADPSNPSTWPRDGRMRRKNMRLVDEDLYTTADHLNGIDLNRNNDPYWNTNANRSSSDRTSLVHHGAGPQSENETQALDVAAALGPAVRLRIFTDVHSYSQVHFWVANDNFRLALQTERVLETFSNHHIAYPAAKFYAYSDRNSVAKNQGIGTTDEYFTHIYQVPSWTLEVEPSSGDAVHAPLPGGGADYGGLGQNGHDGFILPESEIRRVREQLAESFAAVYYRQAGPPSIQSVKMIDTVSGAVVYEAGWDIVGDQTRQLYKTQLQDLQLDRSYDVWMSFNKPMRWRENGEVVAFQGQPDSGLEFSAIMMVGDTALNATVETSEWLDQPGGAPHGYVHYRDDALKITFKFDPDQQNQDLITGGAEGVLHIGVADMVGMHIDANPATIADWKDGNWVQYEDEDGGDLDFGGIDHTLLLQISDQQVADPFVIEPGITSSWYDPSHNGEGFLIEILSNDRAVMYWYTYDGSGAQDWYFAVGSVTGNLINFPQLLQASGGVFGPDFDPDNVTFDPVGSASFLWSGCNQGAMDYRMGPKQDRMELSRIITAESLDCTGSEPLPDDPATPPPSNAARLTGSWYDPSHNGEGFNVEMLKLNRVLVYWFTYDTNGNRRWFYGVGAVDGDSLIFDEMFSSSGGVFGPDFDPDTVSFDPWGTLELNLNCSSGTASYNSTEEGFGSGTLDLVRLTTIPTLECPD